MDRLVDGVGVIVEHILSGGVDHDAGYLQDHDEWVTVLAGGAVIEVGGDALSLNPGDWLVLPARVPHRVRTTVAGTSWLAVHLPPA